MELSTKQKIILATIECIEKEGINAATIRSIAREADVNSAAINYYFGSKEKLIEEAFEYIQKDVMMDLTKMIKEDSDLKTTVEELLLYLMQGVIKYPNISRAVYNNNNSIFITKINEMCQELYDKIGRKHIMHDEKEYKVNIVQLISSSLLMGISPGFFKDFLNMDLKDEETLKDYIEKLTDVFINTIAQL